MLKVVVPLLLDLRNVPVLSKRGEPPPEPSVRALCAWNRAPARLVITALFRLSERLPVHTTVPPFSSGRARVRVKVGLLMVSVAPGAMIIRPLPLNVPEVQ